MIILDESYSAKLRKEIVDTANAILEEKADLIDGAAKLASLSHHLSDNGMEEDFKIFIAISSDMDHLPTAGVRMHYSDSGLKKADFEIKKIEKRYEADVQTACYNLLQKYRNVT